MARKRVVELTAATATLSKNQSGSVIVLNRAAGIAVTLPTGARGLNYEFVIKEAITINDANDYAIIGGSVRGLILVVSNVSATLAVFAGDPDTATRISLSGAGSTGGARGTHLKAECDKDGVWTISGLSQHLGDAAGGESLTPWI